MNLKKMKIFYYKWSFDLHFIISTKLLLLQIYALYLDFLEFHWIIFIALYGVENKRENVFEHSLQQMFLFRLCSFKRLHSNIWFFRSRSFHGILLLNFRFTFSQVTNDMPANICLRDESNKNAELNGSGWTECKP